MNRRADVPLHERMARERNGQGRNMHELASILLTEEWLNHEEEREPFEWVDFTSCGVRFPGENTFECEQGSQQAQSIASRADVDPESTMCDQLEWLDDLLVSEILEEENQNVNISEQLLQQLGHENSMHDVHGWVQESQQNAAEHQSVRDHPQEVERKMPRNFPSHPVYSMDHPVYLQSPLDFNAEKPKCEVTTKQDSDLIPELRSKAQQTILPGEACFTDDPFEGPGRTRSSNLDDCSDNPCSPSSKKVGSEFCMKEGASRSTPMPRAPKHRVLDERKRLANRRAAARSHVKKTLTSKLLRVEYSEQQKRLEELQQEKKAIEMAIESAQEELCKLQTRTNVSSHKDKHKAISSLRPNHQLGN